MKNPSVWKSFEKAIEGLKFIFKTHKHFKIEIAAGILAIALGFILKIPYFEWLILLLIIFLGLIIESLNTALEELCNLIQKQHSYTVKIAKDISSTAMLLFVVMSLIIASIIFVPRIIPLFSY